MSDMAAAREALAAIRRKLADPPPAPGVCWRCDAEVTDWRVHQNMHFEQDTAHWNAEEGP